jgi:hypothetical protein
MREADPDNDQMYYGLFHTRNYVHYQPKAADGSDCCLSRQYVHPKYPYTAQVVAVGAVNWDSYVSLLSVNPHARVTHFGMITFNCIQAYGASRGGDKTWQSYGGNNLLPSESFAQDMRYADEAINLVYLYKSLQVGEVVSFTFTYDFWNGINYTQTYPASNENNTNNSPVDLNATYAHNEALIADLADMLLFQPSDIVSGEDVSIAVAISRARTLAEIDTLVMIQTVRNEHGAAVEQAINSLYIGMYIFAASVDTKKMEWYTIGIQAFTQAALTNTVNSSDVSGYVVCAMNLNTTVFANSVIEVRACLYTSVDVDTANTMDVNTQCVIGVNRGLTLTNMRIPSTSQDEDSDVLVQYCFDKSDLHGNFVFARNSLTVLSLADCTSSSASVTTVAVSFYREYIANNEVVSSLLQTYKLSGSETTSPTKFPVNVSVSDLEIGDAVAIRAAVILQTNMSTQSNTHTVELAFTFLGVVGSGSTPAPTPLPTREPSASPSTSIPTITPSALPTKNSPSSSPTPAPSPEPTTLPSLFPTVYPTTAPTFLPSAVQTVRPTESPTLSPTSHPTSDPTAGPTVAPIALSTNSPTQVPTHTPTPIPTNMPTHPPTVTPTDTPTDKPTDTPTVMPTELPSPEIVCTHTVLELSVDDNADAGTLVGEPLLGNSCNLTVQTHAESTTSNQTLTFVMQSYTDTTNSSNNVSVRVYTDYPMPPFVLVSQMLDINASTGQLYVYNHTNITTGTDYVGVNAPTALEIPILVFTVSVSVGVCASANCSNTQIWLTVIVRRVYNPRPLVFSTAFAGLFVPSIPENIPINTRAVTSNTSNRFDDDYGVLVSANITRERIVSIMGQITVFAASGGNVCLQKSYEVVDVQPQVSVNTHAVASLTNSTQQMFSAIKQFGNAHNDGMNNNFELVANTMFDYEVTSSYLVFVRVRDSNTTLWDQPIYGNLTHTNPRTTNTSTHAFPYTCVDTHIAVNYDVSSAMSVQPLVFVFPVHILDVNDAPMFVSHTQTCVATVSVIVNEVNQTIDYVIGSTHAEDGDHDDVCVVVAMDEDTPRHPQTWGYLQYFIGWNTFHCEQAVNGHSHFDDVCARTHIGTGNSMFDVNIFTASLVNASNVGMLQLWTNATDTSATAAVIALTNSSMLTHTNAPATAQMTFNVSVVDGGGLMDVCAVTMRVIFNVSVIANTPTSTPTFTPTPEPTPTLTHRPTHRPTATPTHTSMMYSCPHQRPIIVWENAYSDTVPVGYINVTHSANIQTHTQSYCGSDCGLQYILQTDAHLDLFTVNTSTGAVFVRSPGLDYELSNRHTLIVQVMDANTSLCNVSVTVIVRDVPDCAIHSIQLLRVANNEPTNITAHTNITRVPLNQAQPGDVLQIFGANLGIAASSSPSTHTTAESQSAVSKFAVRLLNLDYSDTSTTTDDDYYSAHTSAQQQRYPAVIELINCSRIDNLSASNNTYLECVLPVTGVGQQLAVVVDVSEYYTYSSANTSIAFDDGYYSDDDISEVNQLLSAHTTCHCSTNQSQLLSFMPPQIDSLVFANNSVVTYSGLHLGPTTRQIAVSTHIFTNQSDVCVAVFASRAYLLQQFVATFVSTVADEFETSGNQTLLSTSSLSFVFARSCSVKMPFTEVEVGLNGLDSVKVASTTNFSTALLVGNQVRVCCDTYRTSVCMFAECVCLPCVYQNSHCNKLTALRTVTGDSNC